MRSASDGQTGWPSYTGSSFTGTASPLMCGNDWNPDGIVVQTQGDVADSITGLTVNGKPLAITQAV